MCQELLCAQDPFFLYLFAPTRWFTWTLTHNNSFASVEHSPVITEEKFGNPQIEFSFFPFAFSPPFPKHRVAAWMKKAFSLVYIRLCVYVCCMRKVHICHPKHYVPHEKKNKSKVIHHSLLGWYHKDLFLTSSKPVVVSFSVSMTRNLIKTF